MLFGKRLDELNITVDLGVIADDGNTTDLGYSPLLGSIGGNPDSDTLLDFMLREGSVVSIDHKDNTMVWHAEKAEQWLSNIHSGASRLQPLAHVTQGGPGRMTEEEKMQLTNTTVGRRHLFNLPALNTLAVWSNYSKSTKVTGAFNRISRLLFILIRLIRLIEILYHLGGYRFRKSWSVLRQFTRLLSGPHMGLRSRLPTWVTT